MTGVTSAGILLYRLVTSGTGTDVGEGAVADMTVEVFIAHMGGPYWARKDEGAWSIPKGEYIDEDSLTAAKREFHEEIGIAAPAERYDLLGDFRQKSGKVVRVFTAETAVDVAFVGSNTFELEWPPRSGQTQHFAEIDRARWLSLAEAGSKVVAGQRPALQALATRLASRLTAHPTAPAPPPLPPPTPGQGEGSPIP